MKELRIEWISDETECSQAGCSGGWSEGAKVWLDGEELVTLEPIATCFGGDSWTREEVYNIVLAKLGYAVIEN